jgi:anti-sigma factor RsiW
MCQERERLIGYVYGECDPAERQAIEEHLVSCDPCRREIAGLRRVRQDLLAWDVPDHEPVWRPLEPRRVEPRWQTVPAWAMAAAAAVILAVGAASGVATHALLGHDAPQTAQAVAPAAAPISVPARLSDDELSAIEERMLTKLRLEMASRTAARTALAAQPDLARVTEVTNDLARQVRVLSSRQDEFSRTLIGVANETMGIRSVQTGLQQENRMFVNLLQSGPAGFGGGR